MNAVSLLVMFKPTCEVSCGRIGHRAELMEPSRPDSPHRLKKAAPESKGWSKLVANEPSIEHLETTKLPLVGKTYSFVQLFDESTPK